MRRRNAVVLGLAIVLVSGVTTLVGVSNAADDTKAPSTPAKLAETDKTATSLSLKWKAAKDNVAVTTYDIYHDGNKLTEAKGEATSHTVTELKPKTVYRITVFARDAAGNVSDSSNKVETTTSASSDPTPPTAPKKLKSTKATASSVALSWRASTDNKGVVGYDVYNGDTVLAPDVKGTSTTVDSLASNTDYTFTVKAKDAVGNASSASNKVAVKTKAGQGGGVGEPSDIKTVVDDLSIPWGIDWLPDGSALVGERDSFAIHQVTQAGKKTKVGEVPDVQTTDGEGGLLGIAVSPKFASDKLIFVYHTAEKGNQIVKMTFDGGKLGTPSVILTGMKKKRFHNGGRLKFGPDGFLYATVGDAQQDTQAQDKESLNGKILRMTTDGKPAPGNPFDSVVYSYGHRNPQGIAWDSDGRLWESEFGNSEFDELNLIKPGANYGWPTCEGNCDNDGMTNPKRTWPVGDASPSGIAIVDDVVYMAALRGQRLWRIPLKGENAENPKAYFVSEYGRLRTVETIPGAKAIWLSTTNADGNGGKPDGSDKIFRVELK